MAQRIVVENVSPTVAGGRYPAKAVVAEQVPVLATIWTAGHDAVGATVWWRGPADKASRSARMSCTHPGRNEWLAVLGPDRPGRWTFRVDGWLDPWADWRHAVEAKVAAGQNPDDVAVDLEEGALLLARAAADPVRAGSRKLLLDAARRLRRRDLTVSDRLAGARAPDVDAVLREHPIRDRLTTGPTRELWVDRPRAAFGAWYELFPRSTGGRDAAGRPVHGTFRTAAAELPRIADMGFDVVYLPPIHPIGERHRKGRNNSETAAAGDVGSPWAIGSARGGHDAIHPELGTIEDFDAFVARTNELGMEVALDLALQCAPDHPWVAEHPEWFTTRPDGSIAYAENPPKRYQDIYPLNFDNDRLGLYAEILRIVLHWVDRGVRIFRVDNPHTKPPDFWHWLIWRIKATHPDVLFLSEAFTTPARLYGLARLGFTQSYTYFTWRTTKAELTDFGGELLDHVDEARPNLFVNTPDILPAHLQGTGPAAFAIRAALAATLGPTWGVYSGFELFEDTPLREDGEEYLDSEKYELRPRDYDTDRSLRPWLTRLNEIRRAHPALHQLRTLRFHHTDEDALLAYSKASGEDTVLVVVNLDPATTRAGIVSWDLDALGVTAGTTFAVLDEVSGERFEWNGHDYVRLDPDRAVAHILAVMRS